MNQIHRTGDITPIEGKKLIVQVDGQKVETVSGETVLSVMMTTGIREVMENDHKVNCGAYCGMGVCHCCHVKINGRYKQRACQTIVESNMDIQTQANRFQDVGVDK